MANPYRLETPPDTEAAKKLHIATLINELSRTLDILTADLEHEELLVKVGNVGATDEVLARHLRTRRDNISITIAALEAYAIVLDERPLLSVTDLTRTSRKVRRVPKPRINVG
jgi:hypothetical protein